MHTKFASFRISIYLHARFNTHAYMINQINDYKNGGWNVAHMCRLRIWEWAQTIMCIEYIEHIEYI